MSCLDIILNYPNLTRSDLAVYTAIDRLGPDCYQADIASLAGIKDRQVKYSLTKLESVGLIETSRIYDKAEQKTKNTYRLPMGTNMPIAPSESNEGDVQSPASMGTNMPIAPLESGPKTPINEVIGTNVPPMNHDDHDDINRLLDFLDVNNREKLMRKKHVTLAYAAEWREWWDRGDFGKYHNPAGFAADEISKGRLPSLQRSLPEGQIDLSEFRSRGMGVEEIAALGEPDEELVYNEQGLLVRR